MLEISKKIKEKYSLLVIEGELDFNNTKKLREIFQNELEFGIKDLIVDLQKVTYIDSSGIGCFISVMNQLRARNGNIFLVGLRPEVFRIFQLTKLTGFFKFFQSEEELEKKLYPT